ncbi:MAG: hypothetical protein F4Z31_23370 [Gemmatimonadetes bacterium]|nr:ATP-binding protein [Gemmatimonadota bacterium]MYA44675.1 hypothetical protein [Gemmatimonadota bacterium]MYE92830.1 hypothetical protein [Gemmatimonadota bacterium]MYJ11300.1 hypothetical protein [Gemmatimonadota bacterium]
MRVPLRPAVLGAGTVAVVLISAVAWSVARVVGTGMMYREHQQHLEPAVRLGAEQLRASRDIRLDSIASALALATGYRVSVFDAQLSLLADSDLGPGQADTIVDRARRAEVAAALLRVDGFARRVSSLDGLPYLFSATRVYWGGGTIVIRFGAPANPIREAASATAVWVALAVAAAGLVVLLFLHRFVRVGAASVDNTRILLQRLGAGQFSGPRVKLSKITELARLASAANRVRGEMEEQVSRVTRERDELAHLMDEVAEGLIALTDDARILRINPAATQLLGLVEVLPFSPIGSVVRDPELRDLLESSVVRPEARLELTVGDRELEVRTKRGTEGGSVVLLVDMTEIRRLEAVRSDFVANASHELKTPLTVIRAAAETVLDEGLPEDLRHQFLHSIESNTVRLQRLVDDLLDLSRYESGAWRPERQPFSAERVAWSVWEELEAKRAGGDVGFRVEGSGEGSGDEAAVYQVFRNLFENALRYVPEQGGQVIVDIRADGESLRISVRDNGTGIPAASLPRIFERFYRVDAARSREEGGTGLGLAIVRHLVSSMGGTVVAESTWGSGTTITFTVPLHGAVPARMASA